MLFEAFVSAFMKFASDKVYYSGQSNMLYQPEYADINKLREVMKVLEDSSLFRQLANHEGNVAIEISGDNDLIQVDDMAVVSSKFHISDDEEGQLMIVGPTRMQYSKSRRADGIHEPGHRGSLQKRRIGGIRVQDEKKIVKEENAVPEEAQEEAVPKESEADTEVTQEESAEAEKKPRKEKKLLKKDRTAELEAKIAELEQALADQKNAYYKAYADTENLKKRLHAEAETTRKYRIQSFALELLPILDALERALAVPSEDENIQNYVKGFEMIHDQLVGILEKEGVKEIDALNKPFDHNYHQALMQEPVEGVESGIVVEVLQKGYMLKDRVLRAALVKVSE